MAMYYPDRLDLKPKLDFKAMAEQFPTLGLVNVAEEQRRIDVAARRKRGKAPPKKKTEKCAFGLRSYFGSDVLPAGRTRRRAARSANSPGAATMFVASRGRPMSVQSGGLVSDWSTTCL
jgi:hypothetical protein